MRLGSTIPRNPLRICWNMRVIELGERFSSHTIENWRISRGETSLRPPPGGAHAAASSMSFTFLKKSFDVS